MQSVFVFFLFAFFLFVSPASAGVEELSTQADGAKDSDYVEGELLVKYKPSVRKDRAAH